MGMMVVIDPVRAFALVLVTLALAACEPPQPGTRDPEPIEPAAESTAPPVLSAEGYGAVRIGMTVAEASAALGQTLAPEGVVDEDSASCHTVYAQGQPQDQRLTFMVEQGRITRISDYGDASSMSPAADTAAGIGVGSTDAQVRAAYPNAIETPAKYNDPPAHDLTIWAIPDQNGIRFEVNERGQVVALHAGGPSIQYVEGCA